MWYRKKVGPIEAQKWTGAGDFDELCEFLGYVPVPEYLSFQADEPYSALYLGEDAVARPGDYVLKTPGGVCAVPGEWFEENFEACGGPCADEAQEK